MVYFVTSIQFLLLFVFRCRELMTDSWAQSHKAAQQVLRWWTWGWPLDLGILRLSYEMPDLIIDNIRTRYLESVSLLELNRPLE